MKMILIAALALGLAACEAEEPTAPTTPVVVPDEEKPERPKPCAPNETGCERPL